MTTNSKIKPVKTKAKSKVAQPFPAMEIESCIRDFLTDEAAMQAELHGDKKPTENLNNSVGPHPDIDSLVCVEVLLELESIVPFPLSESLIRAGGYNNVDEVVKDLMPQLNDLWQKNCGEESS